MSRKTCIKLWKTNLLSHLNYTGGPKTELCLEVYYILYTTK